MQGAREIIQMTARLDQGGRVTGPTGGQNFVMIELAQGDGVRLAQAISRAGQNIAASAAKKDWRYQMQGPAALSRAEASITAQAAVSI